MTINFDANQRFDKDEQRMGLTRASVTNNKRFKFRVEIRVVY